ncbi:hypothetical protein D3C74_415650 [compost metagenome]
MAVARLRTKVTATLMPNPTAKVQLSFGIFAFVGSWDVKVHLIEDNLAEKGDLSKFELHIYI